jgi:rRNA maturation endonuclease Nob1
MYELDPAVGKRIARGEEVEIQPQDLERVQSRGWGYAYKRCQSCGFETAEDFAFCPKCGRRF